MQKNYQSQKYKSTGEGKRETVFIKVKNIWHMRRYEKMIIKAKNTKAQAKIEKMIIKAKPDRVLAVIG